MPGAGLMVNYGVRHAPRGKSARQLGGTRVPLTGTGSPGLDPGSGWPARVSASQVAEGVCPPVHPDHAHAAATGREHIFELCGIPSTRRATDFDQNQGLHVNYVFD
jgi:hypothetical protein